MVISVLHCSSSRKPQTVTGNPVVQRKQPLGFTDTCGIHSKIGKTVSRSAVHDACVSKALL